MKKLILAALLAATTASANAAVNYTFSGLADDGGIVSGAITIDTDMLAGLNGATDPALYYYYDTTNPTDSNVAGSFLTVSFTSTGSNPALLSSGGIADQLLQADPADGSLQFQVDWAIDNGDGTQTTSQFYFSGFTLTNTQTVGGALVPEFSSAGSVFFTALSSTGDTGIADIISTGSFGFAAGGAVPEASTWAMMALGFGAVGFAARRRTRVAFAA